MSVARAVRRVRQAGGAIARGADNVREYGYVLITLAAQGASIVFYLLLARGLAPAVYGDSMAGVAAALFVAGTLNFGSNSHLVREITRGVLGSEDLASRIIGRVGYSVVAGALVGVFGIVVSGQNWLFGLGLALLTVSYHGAQLFLVAPLAMRRLVLAGLVQLADKTIALVLAALMFSLDMVNGVLLPYMIAAGNFVSILTVLVMVFPLARSKGLGRRFNWSPSLIGLKLGLINPWRGSASIGVSSVAFSMQQLDVSIIRTIAGAAPAGEYAAVSRWNQPASLVASSLGQAILPKLSSAGSVRGALWVVMRLWPVNLAVIGCASVGFYYADPLVDVALGAAYSQSSGALKILMAIIPLSFFSNQLFTLLVSQRLDRLCAKYVVAAMIIGLASQPILALSYGSTGAAIGFGLGQVLLLICLLFLCGKYMIVRSVRSGDHRL